MMPILEQARKDHPGETANLLEILAGWRRRILAGLPEWARQEPSPRP